MYSENIIEQIYKKLIEKNIEYSEELTKLITNFFIKNIKKADSSCLFYIIKNKKEQLEKSTISYLNQFSLKKNEFFQIEENENLKLFIKLSKAKMIPNLTDCKYKKSCLSIKNEISQDLYSGNIKYKDISPFYLNNQKEILYNRILLLDNNNGEKENGIKNKVNEYMEKIDIILEDLKLINEYLKLYFEKTHKNKIQQIEDYINDIYKNNINYYETIYHGYEQLKNEFKNEANANLIFKDCKLFILIVNNLKKINKYSEKERLSKANNFIDIMKKILDENTTKNININVLEEYAKLIDINKDQLYTEIKKLTSILKIEKGVNFYRITEDLFLLRQKYKIKILVEMFINYIEKCNTIKTIFYNLLQVIGNNINQSKEMSVIKLSKSILNTYKIDLDNNDNKIIDIFMKLGQDKEKNNFLLDPKNHSDQFLKRLGVVNKENNNIFVCVEKCILYIKDTMNSNGNKKLTDIELINNIFNEFENIEMVNYFNNYLEQYDKLIGLI